MSTTPAEPFGLFDTFESFSAQAQARGFDAVLVREWAPCAETGLHTHPFAVQAQVVRGEFWVGCGRDGAASAGGGCLRAGRRSAACRAVWGGGGDVLGGAAARAVVN